VREHSRHESSRWYARSAGIAYLIIIVCGIYAQFVVRSNLIVPDDAVATAGRIAGSPLLFRSALASEFIMLACDVFVAMALYVVFESVSRSLALLAAFLRLVHAAVVAGNLLNTYVPLLLLGTGGGLASFEPTQRSALALLFLNAHSYGYVIGLVFFGFQCLILGYLLFRATYGSQVVGVLLACAGTGYLIDGFARTLLTQYAAYETVFAVIVFAPALIGELMFAVWLLANRRIGRECRIG
jgi:hypothetical protein